VTATIQALSTCNNAHSKRSRWFDFYSTTAWRGVASEPGKHTSAIIDPKPQVPRAVPTLRVGSLERRGQAPTSGTDSSGSDSSSKHTNHSTSCIMTRNQPRQDEPRISGIPRARARAVADRWQRPGDSGPSPTILPRTESHPSGALDFHGGGRTPGTPRMSFRRLQLQLKGFGNHRLSPGPGTGTPS
jgi:hypothetical protein